MGKRPSLQVGVTHYHIPPNHRQTEIGVHLTNEKQSLSPEIDIIVGPDVVDSTEGRAAVPPWPGACDPAGVEEQGTLRGGSARNLGGREKGHH